MSEVECENCGGTGEVTCDRCGGTGSLPGFATWGGGFTSCDVCYGSGYIPCLECNGDGYIEKDDEEDDNGSVFNESNNSPLPITGEHSVIHTDMGRTYTINNKKYLLTNQGFRREHNGNIYRFPYEKSTELIKIGEAVPEGETDKGYSQSQVTLHSNSTTESKKEEPAKVAEEPDEAFEEPVEASIDHIYIVNNKKYVLTSQGFMREHNGNNYRFSYEKSMELLSSGEAVLIGKTIQEDATSHINTSSNSSDVVSINIDNEVIEKITYEYHNKRVTTYNKSGHTIRHWGVPYSLFLDYVNSNHHYEFRKKYFTAYGSKILEKYHDDFIFYKFEEEIEEAQEIEELLSANSIESIILQDIHGIRLVDRHDYSWDNIRGNRLNEDVEFFPYTPKPPYYEEDEDYGYWFLVSKSLSEKQLRVLSTIFDYKETYWFEELFL